MELPFISITNHFRCINTMTMENYQVPWLPKAGKSPSFAGIVMRSKKIWLHALHSTNMIGGPTPFT